MYAVRQSGKSSLGTLRGVENVSQCGHRAHEYYEALKPTRYSEIERWIEAQRQMESPRSVD